MRWNESNKNMPDENTDASIQRWLAFLEAEWSKPEGFLGRAREGLFDSQRGDEFVELDIAGKVELEHSGDVVRWIGHPEDGALNSLLVQHPGRQLFHALMSKCPWLERSVRANHHTRPARLSLPKGAPFEWRP